MKYVYFKKIDEAEDLIRFINENDGEIVVYYDCQGGNCHRSAMLIDVLNQKRITLYLIGFAFSMGFEIFFSCTKANRKIHNQALGMHHLYTRSFEMASNGKCNFKEDRPLFKLLKDCTPRIISFCKKIGMPEAQIDLIKDNEDVYFTATQMRKFLK